MVRGITVVLVTEHELALVVGAPQAIGVMSGGQCCALGFVAFAFVSFDEAMSVEYDMDSTDGRRLDHEILTNDLVARL